MRSLILLALPTAALAQPTYPVIVQQSSTPATYTAPTAQQRTIQVAGVQQALFASLKAGALVTNLSATGMSTQPVVWVDWTVDTAGDGSTGAKVGAACNASGGAFPIYPATYAGGAPGYVPVPATASVVTICSPAPNAIVSASGG